MSLANPRDMIPQLQAAQGSLLNCFDAIDDAVAKLDAVESGHKVWEKFNHAREITKEPLRRCMGILRDMNSLVQMTIDAAREGVALSDARQPGNQ